MKEFEALLAYSFHNPGLLEQALTHSSYANEHRDRQHNERLEFLGDAVLELCSSSWLYGRYPREPEGNLSRRRAAMVCEASLAACARSLGLGEALFLGKGEDKSGGREKDSLLADALEAVIGAIYLDGGFDAALGFVRQHLMDPLPESGVFIDAKTRLQELLQKDGDIEIFYRLQATAGAGGEEAFLAEVLAAGKPLGSGRGHNRKQAEQQAAQAALEALHTDSFRESNLPM